MRRAMFATATIAAALCVNSSWGADDDIIFAPKNFVDAADMMVGISGTLSGDGVRYKNNTYSITCIKEHNRCFVSSVEQIGNHHIGRMDYVSVYPITKWDADEVTAAEQTADTDCSRTTLTLIRKNQTALWVQEPINQTRPQCKESDTKTHKWTVEDSLGWKRGLSR